MDVYLGVDVGSVTTKFALVTGGGEVIAYNYLRTQGRPIAVVQQGLGEIRGQLPARGEIRGACTTGSARYLAGVILGADLVKNEITAQAVAALHYVPGARTIIEIGGQDSKLILLRDGMVDDFAMNTVCAAGTGSFLEQQGRYRQLPRAAGSAPRHEDRGLQCVRAPGDRPGASRWALHCFR